MPSTVSTALSLVSLPALCSARAIKGVMTMWSEKPDVIVGSTGHEGGPSACLFADPANGGLKSPAASSPYIKNRMYCAADIYGLFEDGRSCGKCFRISYDGNGGSDSGRAGEAVIEIVNSGHMAHNAEFDCQVDAFKKITGATTGFFPITYHEVGCDESDGRGRATILDGGNAWFTKVVFSDLVRPPTGVELVADGQSAHLKQAACCGTWSGQLKGGSGPVTFKLTFDDDSTSTWKDCFKKWPAETSDYCEQGGKADKAEEENVDDSELVEKPDKKKWDKCSGPWSEDCRETRCCMDEGFICYKKSKHWAGCMTSCDKGLVDEYSNHPWECEDITELAEAVSVPIASGLPSSQAALGAAVVILLAVGVFVSARKRSIANRGQLATPISGVELE